MITALLAMSLLHLQDTSPTTDAPDTAVAVEALLDDFRTGFAREAEILGEVADWQARERHLQTRIIAAIRRDDIAAELRADYLGGVQAEASDFQLTRARWATDRVAEPGFARLLGDASAAARQVLLWSEQDPDSLAIRVEALEPAARSGTYEAQTYAELADILALSQNNRQIYGTQTECVNGLIETAPIRAAGRVNQRREGIGLLPLDTTPSDVGEACTPELAGAE